MLIAELLPSPETQLAVNKGQSPPPGFAYYSKLKLHEALLLQDALQTKDMDSHHQAHKKRMQRFTFFYSEKRPF